MVCVQNYPSPLGDITIAADGEYLIGLWFIKQRCFGNVLPKYFISKETHVLKETKRWLDIYFSGREPDFTPSLKYDSTSFRKAVCDIMLTIPYGKTISYGEIADIIAKQKSIKKMSAQAVGGAVGHNPISIIIPCHRVVGSNGSLTGYGGGINRKVKLLELEKTDMSAFFIPRKGAAL